MTPTLPANIISPSTIIFIREITLGIVYHRVSYHSHAAVATNTDLPRCSRDDDLTTPTANLGDRFSGVSRVASDGSKPQIGPDDVVSADVGSDPDNDPGNDEISLKISLFEDLPRYSTNKSKHESENAKSRTTSSVERETQNVWWKKSLKLHLNFPGS